MSAPVSSPNTLKADGLSHSKNAQLNRGTAPAGGASFAAEMQKRLKKPESVEQRAPEVSDDKAAGASPPDESAGTPPCASSPSDAAPAQGQADSRRDLDKTTDDSDDDDASEEEPITPMGVEGTAALAQAPANPATSSVTTDSGATGSTDGSAVSADVTARARSSRPATNAGPTAEGTGAAQVDPKGQTEAESGKGLTASARQGIGEKLSDSQPAAALGDRGQGPVPTAGDQHTSTRHDLAAAMIRGAQSQTAGGPSPTAAAPTTPTLSAAELPDGLGNQIRWMMNHQSSVAELKLHPADLGKMEVKLALDKDVMNVHFLVHNAAAKDAVEHALPRLRTLLNDVGVNLQNINVKEHSAGDHGQNAHSGLRQDPHQVYGEEDGGSQMEADGGMLTAPARAISDRMIDAFA